MAGVLKDTSMADKEGSGAQMHQISHRLFSVLGYYESGFSVT